MATLNSLISSIPNINSLKKHRHNHMTPQSSSLRYNNCVTSFHHANNSIIKARQLDCFTSVSVPSSRTLVMASAAVADGGSMSSRYLDERRSSMMSASFGSSPAVTLDRPKPELSKRTKKPSLKDPLDDIDYTGSGGNANNNVGGGDNGGGGFGDDDDYSDNFDEDDDDGDDGGLFRRRISLQEFYDRIFVESVLKEWQKTMKDLPEGMRLACEMGLISSAQLMKYLMNEARPTVTRTISRALSKSMSRALIGRITADPAFLHKLLFEQLVTLACSVHSELKTRGQRTRQEWDLALINVVTVTACNLVVVWSLAPCNLYANTSSFDLQNRLNKFPNNIFESSYRHRSFDAQQRIKSFVCKAVQFSLVGFTAGAVQSALSNLCAKTKEGRLSVRIPPANTNALGYGAFLGLYSNWRYQMLCGVDNLLTSHFDVIRVSLFFTAAFRILNAQIGEMSRAAWLDTESLSFTPLKAHSTRTERKKRSIRKKSPSYSLA